MEDVKTKSKSKPIADFKLAQYSNPGTVKKQTKEWREALEVGEQASTLSVVCAVDCINCTFKVSTNFTTIQFHSHDKRSRVAMLSKIAAMMNSAGEWGLERAAYFSELREKNENPAQLTIGDAIPGQANGGSGD